MPILFDVFDNNYTGVQLSNFDYSEIGTLFYIVIIVILMVVFYPVFEIDIKCVSRC